MNSNVTLYKILDKNPSIYAEINEVPYPFDVELYLNAVLIDSAHNKNTHHIFEIKAPGVYSVTVKNKNSLPYHSNSLSFFIENFQPSGSLDAPEHNGTIKLNADEPVIDDISIFYVEIKITKERASDIKKIMTDHRVSANLQKKHVNLNSFQTNHSIHKYEYYKTSNTLSKEDAKDICRKIKGVEGIVYCSIVPVTDNLPPPKLNTSEKPEKYLEILSVTPDFSEMQAYLDAPHGMNVRDAWSNGHSGESVAIRHLDFGIYKNHEDFQGGNVTVVNSRDETDDCNHGTASAGCIAAGNSRSGVTGIAHSSSFYFYDTGDKDKILEQANPGDIISLDIQWKVNGVYVPAIAIKSWWDTIYNLTEKGAIVIAAAGNSGVDLSDTSICPDFGDSGAMLVGACASSTGRRLSFSNYGHHSSLINSWGQDVVTTGYGALQNLPGHDRDYTDSYSGTSSATPLCSGALALLQCYAKKQGLVLTAASMKQLLSKSDYAEGIYDRIGQRPNVKQLLTHIDMALLPAYQENPFPTSANYVNHNAFFGFNLDSEVKINFDYRFSDIINAGVITYYSSEGPAELEWYSWGYSNVKIPVFDSNGQISVMYIRAYKMINQSAFTMNSAADMKDKSPGTFDLVLKFIAEDNKHLSSHNYKGVLPLYIKSWSTKDYQLPVRINIFID